MTIACEITVGVQDGSSEGLRHTDSIIQCFVGNCQYTVKHKMRILAAIALCRNVTVIRNIHLFFCNHKGKKD
jgi:hypothetical protein